MNSSSYSYSSITSQTEGQGSVHTHIESTVNGITKTLDSNKPGTYTVINNGPTDPPTTADPTPILLKTIPVAKPTVLTQAAHALNNTAVFYTLFLAVMAAGTGIMLARKLRKN